jgi:3-mercaptopropionate dioxygenase
LDRAPWTLQTETAMTTLVPPPLKRFIWDIQSMVELAESEREILLIGRDLMGRLVATDDWIPDAFSLPGESRAAHYLLYRDALERFLVGCTVLRAGQATLTRQDKAWEIFGLLRGAVVRSGAGAEAPANAKAHRAGGLDAKASTKGEAAVKLANPDAPISIAIHVYGGDIGALSRFALAGDGAAGEPMAQYANPDDAPAYDIWSIQTKIDD